MKELFQQAKNEICGLLTDPYFGMKIHRAGKVALSTLAAASSLSLIYGALQQPDFWTIVATGVSTAFTISTLRSTAKNSSKAFVERLLGFSKKAYLAEKAELEEAIKRTKENPSASPAVKNFSDMIDSVAAMPDKLARIKAVNAWVNIKLAYDYDVLETRAAKHPSMLGALTNGKTICDTSARLKLFALEKAGFGPDEVEVVAQHIRENGKMMDVGHAVVFAHIGAKTWVLNSQDASDDAPRFKRFDVDTVRWASEIETKEAQENAFGQSISGALETYHAAFGFNSERIIFYPQSKQEKAVSLPRRRVGSENTKLSNEEVERFHLTSVLASAFPANYAVFKRRASKPVPIAARPHLALTKKDCPTLF